MILGVHRKSTHRIVVYYSTACSTVGNFRQEKNFEDKATFTALGKFNPLNIIFLQYKVAGLGEIFVQ